MRDTSEEKPFRLAIVGVGLISAQSHLPAAIGLPGVTVAALVDPLTDRSRAIARDYGVSPRITGDLGEVLSDIDGAIIATPNNLHMPLAVRCLEAGVPVLIEKPLATTIEDGQRIVDVAKARNLTAAAGYSTRFRDNVLLFDRILREKVFGRVRSFAYQFGTGGGWASVSAYSLNREAAGGGVVMVSGTHFIDRMLWWFGYPDQITYEDDSRGGPEANAICRFQYQGQSEPITGLARFSKTTPLPAGQVVETEQGRLILRETDGAQIIFRSFSKPDLPMVIGNDRPSTYPDINDVFQRQLQDFVRACRTGSSPMCSVEHALVSLRLINALYGCRTQIDDDWYAAADSMKAIA